jgi:hypothetical protein
MDEIARLRSISEQAPAATVDVAVQTERVVDAAVPAAEVLTAEVVADAEVTVPTAEAVEESPLPAAAGLIWIIFTYSKVGVQFVKARGARWCNVRGGWYMHSTLSTPVQIEEVLQRYERTATPGRDRNPWELRSSRSRFVTCTRPCLSCSPMYMATLISCIGPVEATATTAYWQHIGGLTPVMRVVYGILFTAVIAQLCKRMHNSGAFALVASTAEAGAVAGGAAANRLCCAALQCMGATALTVDGFMTQVRARHSPSLSAYYTWRL